jgi:RHS repeat-associated protein
MDGLCYSTNNLSTATKALIDPNYYFIPNRSQYNGHETQTQLSLGWVDYGFRQLDPVLCMWHSADKLAETTPWISPYSYAMDDPINQVDVAGLYSTRTYNVETHSWTGNRGGDFSEYEHRTLEGGDNSGTWNGRSLYGGPSMQDYYDWQGMGSLGNFGDYWYAKESGEDMVVYALSLAGIEILNEMNPQEGELSLFHYDFEAKQGFSATFDLSPIMEEMNLTASVDGAEPIFGVTPCAISWTQGSEANLVGAYLSGSLSHVLVLTGVDHDKVFHFINGSFQGGGTPCIGLFVQPTIWLTEKDYAFRVEYMKGKTTQYSIGIGNGALSYSEIDSKIGTIYGVSAIATAGISTPFSIGFANTWSALIGSIWEFFE